MDMWRPYPDAVHRALPHATIVVDKFYALRLAH
ncbi:MAG: transposase [Sulfobacillus sp.]